MFDFNIFDGETMNFAVKVAASLAALASLSAGTAAQAGGLDPNEPVVGKAWAYVVPPGSGTMPFVIEGDTAQAMYEFLTRTNAPTSFGHCLQVSAGAFTCLSFVEGSAMPGTYQCGSSVDQHGMALAPDIGCIAPGGVTVSN
jgi:hypothetical protein